MLARTYLKHRKAMNRHANSTHTKHASFEHKGFLGAYTIFICMRRGVLPIREWEKKTEVRDKSRYIPIYNVCSSRIFCIIHAFFRIAGRHAANVWKPNIHAAYNNIMRKSYTNTFFHPIIFLCTQQANEHKKNYLYKHINYVFFSSERNVQRTDLFLSSPRSFLYLLIAIYINIKLKINLTKDIKFTFYVILPEIKRKQETLI